MNRGYCSRHDHRPNSLAWRLTVARHSYDDDAQRQTAAEIGGDCAECWKAVALAAVDACHLLLLRGFPIPGLTGNGLVTWPSIDFCFNMIDGLLEVEAAGRGAG